MVFSTQEKTIYYNILCTLGKINFELIFFYYANRVSLRFNLNKKYYIFLESEIVYARFCAVYLFRYLHEIHS